MKGEKPKSTTFCPLPWIHLDSKTSGDLRVCSPSAQGPTRGLLRDHEGQIYNLATSSIDESRNAPLLKEIRKAILEGVFHPECHRCRVEEEAGIRSRRLVESEIWSAKFDWGDAIHVTNDAGEITDLPPIHYALRLGNRCNLKCRTCSPTDSSGWYSDYVALNGFRGFKDGDNRLILEANESGAFDEPTGYFNWHENPEFWDDFESNMSSIRAVHMTGGEPFLIQRHFDFLRKCVESGHAAHISLEYNSNLSVLPKELVELWPEFEQVRIGCSIDAVGTANDYIRHPSRFSTIERNLHKLDKMSGNIVLWVACTVSALNILSLDELIKWKLLSGFSRVNALDGGWPLISAHPLHRPGYLSARILPPAAKEKAAEKLLALPAWVDQFANRSKMNAKSQEHLYLSTKAFCESYLRYMMAEDQAELLPEFWSKIRRLDSIRGENIERSLPELYSLIRESEPSPTLYAK